MLVTGPMIMNQAPYATVLRNTLPMEVDVSIHLKFSRPTQSLPRIPLLNL